MRGLILRTFKIPYNVSTCHVSMQHNKWFCRKKYIFRHFPLQLILMTQPHVTCVYYPLQICFGCSRFAANLQQNWCRLICLQERRIYVRRCLQPAALFLWITQLFATYLLQTYVYRKTAENHASSSNNKKCFRWFARNIKSFWNIYRNLRELSTIKIVCKKLTEILNNHIFNLLSHFNVV